MELKTANDVDILNSQDIKTLASWWSQLNRWGWPEELPNKEPAEYKPGGRRSRIMAYISSKIGHKECLRDWNKESMNDEEYESWWENRNNQPNQ